MFLKRKILIFITAFLFFILFLGIIISLLFKKTPEKPFSEPVSGDITSVPTVFTGVLPTLISDEFVPPVFNEGKIYSSGMPVNNFHAVAQIINTNGDTLITNNADYQIVHLDKFDKFLIVIYNPDFEKTQTEAEQNLLAILGIDKPNACRLNAEVSIPQNVQNKYAGLVFPLSFCSDL